MSFFAKIANATASGGGNYIRDGRYTFLVEKLQVKTGHQGTSFIAELRVMEAFPSDERDANGNAITPNPVGSTCSLICNLTKHESAAGNAKAFVEGVLAGFGVAPEGVTESVLADACGPGNPLRGFAVQDTTYRKLIKSGANQGKPITLHKWSGVKQDEAQVKAQRAYLDSNVSSTPERTPDAPPAPVAVPVAPATPGLMALIGGK